MDHEDGDSLEKATPGDQDARLLIPALLDAQLIANAAGDKIRAIMDRKIREVLEG